MKQKGPDYHLGEQLSNFVSEFWRERQSRRSALCYLYQKQCTRALQNLFSLTNSPARIPEEANKSIKAKSRSLVHLSRITSKFSSL